MKALLYFATFSMLVSASSGQSWMPDTVFAPALESEASFTHTVGLLPVPGNKLLVFTPSVNMPAPAAVNGARIANIARLNADGSLDRTFIPSVATLLVPLAAYADGGIAALQLEATATAALIQSVVRLTASGAVDPSFAPSVLSRHSNAISVRGQVIAGDRLLLSGNFLSVGEIAQARVAVLNRDGSRAPGFNSPFSPNDGGEVDALATADGKIFVKGTHLSIAGQYLPYLARLNADGSLDASFAVAADGLPFSPQALYPQADGTVLAAVPYHGLFRLRADGSRDMSFTAQLIGKPLHFSAEVHDGKFYYLREPAPYQRELRRMNVDGTPDVAFGAVAIPEYYAHLAPVRGTDGATYMGSAISKERFAGRLQVSRLLADGSPDPTYNPRLSQVPRVDAFVRQPDGKILVAGGFVTETGATFARLNPDGSLDDTFTGALQGGERIGRLDLQPDGKIVAGGFFSGSARIARFTASGARDASFQLPVQLTEKFAVAANGDIYGTRWDGATLRIERYSADGNLDSTFVSGAPGSVESLAPASDGALYASVRVKEWYDTQPVPTIVRLLPNGTLDPNFLAQRVDLPSPILGLVALPDGRVAAMCTASVLSGEAFRFVRLDRFGQRDYAVDGPSFGITPLMLDDRAGLAVADFLYDRQHDIGVSAAPAALRVDLAGVSSTGTVQLLPDGRAWVLGNSERSPTSFGAFVRAGGAGLSASAAPTVLAFNAPSGAYAMNQGGRMALSVTAGGGAPFTYQWTKDSLPIVGATAPVLWLGPVKVEDAGNYAVMVSNAAGTTTTREVPVSINPVEAAPTITSHPTAMAASAGGSVTMTASARGNPLPSFQWYRDGQAISFTGANTYGSGGSGHSSLRLTDIQPAQAGLYEAIVRTGVGQAATNAAQVGVVLATKVAGEAIAIGNDIRHPNGNIYDQMLLTGAAGAMTADSNQVSRISFVDLTNDIVQVEMSGAGTLTLVLRNPSAPAPALNYNQPSVAYVRGHAGIVITGADETTHVTIFSVGRANAVNQTLFRSDVEYHGIADLSFVAISSASGRFGGLRAGNVNFYASQGFTGVYAPGVTFAGPVYVGDIDAFGGATPTLVFTSAAETRIAGGDLGQTNGEAVKVEAFLPLNFAPGSTSHGDLMPGRENKARFEKEGEDVTQMMLGLR